MFEYLTMFYFLNKLEDRNPQRLYGNHNIDPFLKSIIIRDTTPDEKEMRPRNLPFFEKNIKHLDIKIQMHLLILMLEHFQT